jgi:hypothetical protein
VKIPLLEDCGLTARTQLPAIFANREDQAADWQLKRSTDVFALNPIKIE